MNEHVKELSANCGLPVFPGGRYRTDGPHSGEAFRDDVLAPALLDEAQYTEVSVVFDGVAGFGSGFLEEAFGGLVRVHGMDREFLRNRLRIDAKDDELMGYVDDANEYIEKAHVRLRGRSGSAQHEVSDLDGAPSPARGRGR